MVVFAYRTVFKTNKKDKPFLSWYNTCSAGIRSKQIVWSIRFRNSGSNLPSRAFLAKWTLFFDHLRAKRPPQRVILFCWWWANSLAPTLLVINTIVLRKLISLVPLGKCSTPLSMILSRLEGPPGWLFQFHQRVLFRGDCNCPRFFRPAIAVIFFAAYVAGCAPVIAEL